MVGLFLQNLPSSPMMNQGSLPQGAGPLAVGLLPFSQSLLAVRSYLIIMGLVSLVIYIYLSLAYSRIGAKAKVNSPGIAWMPFGWLAIIFEVSKMHWWPFLVVGLGFISIIIWIGLAIVAMAPLMVISMQIFLSASVLIFIVMALNWHWKTYEAVGKPGWFAIVPVISLVGWGLLITPFPAIFVVGLILQLGGLLLHLIFVGMAAWGRSEKIQKNRKRKKYRRV